MVIGSIAFSSATLQSDPRAPSLTNGPSKEANRTYAGDGSETIITKEKDKSARKKVRDIKSNGEKNMIHPGSWSMQG
jgi:hypothetical protein